jgi:group I intron endonuclease
MAIQIIGFGRNGPSCFSLMARKKFPAPVPGRVFLYALCEPGTRTVRYIGQTKDPRKRFDKHLSASSKNKNHLGYWLRSILDRSAQPNMIILRDVPESDLDLAERKYIRIARDLGMNLTNATEGGEKCSPSPETVEKIIASRAWYRHSEETKAKISRGNRGKVLSPEHIQALRYARSPETRARISAAKMGKRRSKESCAKQSANMKGKPSRMLGKTHSPETREKMRQSHAARLVRKRLEVSNVI